MIEIPLDIVKKETETHRQALTAIALRQSALIREMSGIIDELFTICAQHVEIEDLDETLVSRIREAAKEAEEL